MAAVISVINLKGGVGKTTTTVAVGQMLSGIYGRRVLVIDLDPQTNATVMLIGERAWEAQNRAGLTIAHLFRDALTGARRFNLASAILPDVGGVREARTLSLLPSSLELIEVQEQLASMPTGPFFAANPVEILRHVLRPVLDDYDYVLVDCPPSLGLVTFNGLRISRGYIMPTIPDVLSTYGIPQIMRRVDAFGSAFEQAIEPLGIVVNKYRTQSTVQHAELHALMMRSPAPIFRTVIPESNDVSGAGRFTPLGTLRQKWGKTYDAYRTLTSEIIQLVGYGR